VVFNCFVKAVGNLDMTKKVEIFLRLFADSILLLVASFFGLLLSFSTGSSIEPGTPAITLSAFFASSWLLPVTLLAISLPIFYFAGFYTKGRAYSGQYKAVFVAQISVLAILAWGVSLYLLENKFGSYRTAFIVGGICSIGLVTGARIWSLVWFKLHPPIGGPGYTASVGKDPSTKSVVVIGGAGYIGSGLLRKLLDRGYKVRLVDSFMFGEEPIKDLIGHENLQVMRTDFRQIDKMVEAMYGMDAVVHIGAIVGDPACALDEDFTLEVNLIATRMIAECAKGFGIKKFIFASTCSVYGASDLVLNEKSALNPVSLYARSKIACEKILLEMATDQFKPTILRFGTVYGLSGRTRFDLVVNLLTAKAIVDGKITVFGEDQWRPFVHVDDASLAIATALDASMDVVGGEIFNVGSDEGNLTLGDVGKMIKRMVPTAEYIASGSDADRRNYRVDFSKIKNRLGFRPAWTVEMGIRQVITSFENGEVKDYNATKYSNVKYLAEEAASKGLKTDSQRLRALVEESYEGVAEVK
jgi:nucleoside-diphosphate-sugar epimerase